MSASITSAGVETQTFEAILDEIVEAIATALTLTPAQSYRVRNSVQSVLGNLARIDAEREARMQEALLAVYDALSFNAEGSNLERVVQLLGVTRLGERFSRIDGLADGTNTTVIPAGTRLQHDGDGSTWATVGEVTIGSSPTALRIEAESASALEPDLGGTWTILDAVTGFDSFASVTQVAVGAPIETDAQLRARARVEAYRRGQGPLTSIESSVAAVYGVSFVRAWDNRTLDTNADGIPGKALNVVVEGGADDEVAAAIFAARPAGAEIFALDDGSDVEVTVADGYGFGHVVRFNRVTEIPIHIRATLTTSTSETEAPENLEDFATEVLLDKATELFGIGGDVLPGRLVAALFSAITSGIDAIVVETSLDGSTGWTTAKRSISIRQKPTFHVDNIDIVED